MKNKNMGQFIYIFLILQPILDLLTSFMVRYSDFTITIGMLGRGLFILVLGIYFLFFSKSKHKRKSIIYFGIIGIYFIFYILSKANILEMQYLKVELTYLFKYMYFPIVCVILLNIYDELDLKKEKIFKICLFNVIVYSTFILLPELTGTAFSSYTNANKGSVGWFYAANEIGAIIVALFPYAYYMLFERMSIIRIIIVFMIIVCAMTILGTKTAFLGMIITEFIYLLYFIFNRKKNRALGLKLSICIIILSLVLIPQLPVIKNLQSSISKANETTTETEQDDDEDDDVQPELEKFLKVVFSGRQKFFIRTLNIYNSSSTTDKFLGIGFTNRPEINNKRIEKLIEIDPLDIFFHYGIVGFVLYFLPLLYILFKVLSSLFHHKLKLTFFRVTNLYTIAIVTMISMVAGHVYGAPAVSIYVAVACAMLNSAMDKQNKEKSNLKDKEKITIFALHLGYGGVEKYLSSLCQMLINNYEIEIISTYKILDKPAFDFAKEVKIKYLINDKPNREEFKLALKNRQLFKIIIEGLKSLKILYLKRSRNIKAIRNTYSDYIITTRVFHNKLVSYYGYYDIIKIGTEHNYCDNNKYVRKVINSIKGFDYFVVVSNNLKEFYENKIGKTKCVYIPNVIDSLSSKKCNLNNKNLISIGRLSEEKGHKDLIDVIEIIKKEIPDIKLFLVGDGPLKEDLIKYAKEKGLIDNIIFTGFLKKEEIEKYVYDSAIFILPSYTESFGIVLVEAMSYGLPCIAFDSSDGAKFLLKDGVGILIKDRNKNEMAKEVTNLLNNKEKLKDYSEKGYASCQKYLLSNVEKQWKKLLKGVNIKNENEKKK